LRAFNGLLKKVLSAHSGCGRPAGGILCIEPLRIGRWVKISFLYPRIGSDLEETGAECRHIIIILKKIYK